MVYKIQFPISNGPAYRLLHRPPRSSFIFEIRVAPDNAAQLKKSTDLFVNTSPRASTLIPTLKTKYPSQSGDSRTALVSSSKDSPQVKFFKILDTKKV